jgi:hypothetical protein
MTAARVPRTTSLPVWLVDSVTTVRKSFPDQLSDARSEAGPWAEPKGRFTALFERFAIDVLKETDVLGATRILGIAWDEACHVMKKAVERGDDDGTLAGLLLGAIRPEVSPPDLATPQRRSSSSSARAH